MLRSVSGEIVCGLPHFLIPASIRRAVAWTMWKYSMCGLILWLTW